MLRHLSREHGRVATDTQERGLEGAVGEGGHIAGWHSETSNDEE